MCWPLFLIILVDSNSSSEQRLTDGHNFCNEREALKKASVLEPENYKERKHEDWFMLLKMMKVIGIARILNSTLFLEKFSIFGFKFPVINHSITECGCQKGTEPRY